MYYLLTESPNIAQSFGATDDRKPDTNPTFSNSGLIVFVIFMCIICFILGWLMQKPWYTNRQVQTNISKPFEELDKYLTTKIQIYINNLFANNDSNNEIYTANPIYDAKNIPIQKNNLQDIEKFISSTNNNVLDMPLNMYINDDWKLQLGDCAHIINQNLSLFVNQTIKSLVYYDESPDNTKLIESLSAIFINTANIPEPSMLTNINDSDTTTKINYVQPIVKLNENYDDDMYLPMDGTLTEVKKPNASIEKSNKLEVNTFSNMSKVEALLQSTKQEDIELADLFKAKLLAAYYRAMNVALYYTHEDLTNKATNTQISPNDLIIIFIYHFLKGHNKHDAIGNLPDIYKYFQKAYIMIKSSWRKSL